MITNESEIKINETQQEIATLDQLITEGVDALILYKFQYPNTNNEVGVKLRPITSAELTEAVTSFKALGTSVDIEILHMALYNPDNTPVDYETIKKLPAGVVSELAMKIGEISGLKRDKQEESKMVQNMMGF